MSKPGITESHTQLNEYTYCVDVFVPYCSDKANAIDVATSYYPIDYNASTGRYCRIDGVNELSTGYVVTMRVGYDY